MIEKNTICKILEFFFTYPTRDVHLRELCREVSLSMPAVLSAIHKLQREHLVVVERGKALTNIKANVENLLFMRLKKIHNLERLYLSGLVDFLIKEGNEPQAIICFGSYSRGEDIESSDIDIAILGGNQKEITVDAFEKKLKRSISIHNIHLTKMSEEFKSNLCNGIILHGAL